MFFIKRTPRLFEHIKKGILVYFSIFLDLLAHLPADEGDLLLCEPLLQVHNDGVQGPAITVLNHHLNQKFTYSIQESPGPRHTVLTNTGQSMGPPSK
jgi:hypothetical protein